MFNKLSFGFILFLLPSLNNGPVFASPRSRAMIESPAKFPLCLDLLQSSDALQVIQDFNEQMRHLPAPGSPEWNEFQSQLTADLHPQNGPGFSILNTSRFFPKALMEKLLPLFSPPSEIYLEKTTESTKSETHNKKILTQVWVQGFRLLEEWIDTLLSASMLPHREFPRLSQSSVRFSAQRGCSQCLNEFHEDGGTFAALIALFGKGTLYTHVPYPFWLDDLGEQSEGDIDRFARKQKIDAIPTGALIIMSARNRRLEIRGVKSTIHATPSQPGDRIVFLSRYGVR